MVCVDCGHALRPRGTKAADAPGTLKELPGPRCSGCYSKIPKPGKSRATNCKECDRALRPANVRLSDMPGTVMHAGGSLCKMCWRVERGITGYRRGTRPSHCNNCERPVRPNHSDPVDYPGTIRYSGNGICATCEVNRNAKVRKAKRAEVLAATVTTEGEPIEPTEDVPNVTDPGLLRLRAERNERRRRQEQAQRIRVEQEAVQRRFIARRKVAA